MAQPPVSPSGSTLTARTAYLTLYNFTFAALWIHALIITIRSILAGQSKSEIFHTTSPTIRTIQTLSLLDVLHAALRIVKSPVSTTFIQNATRVIQVWLIWWMFPQTTGESCAYPVLVLAWSFADAVRCFYLGCHLWGCAGKALVWLRYSMFYVLYPVGIGAEWWLFYLASGPAGEINLVLKGVFWFLLGLYAPGAYKMYTYMIAQRRKTFGRKKTV